MNRPLVKQEAVNFSVLVGITPTPINQNMQISAMIDSVLVCVPAAAANGCFIGFDAGVTPVTGIEIPIGATLNFVIDHDGRQLYELQNPLMDAVSKFMCRPYQSEAIPLVVWDVSQLYLVATVAVTVAVACFKAVYI